MLQRKHFRNYIGAFVKVDYDTKKKAFVAVGAKIGLRPPPKFKFKKVLTAKEWVKILNSGDAFAFIESGEINNCIIDDRYFDG